MPGLIHGLILLALAAPQIRAQDIEEAFPGDLPPGVVIVDGQIVQTGDRPESAEGAKPAENKRKAMLEGLEFDRRPSTILLAWSTPEQDPQDKAAAEAGSPESRATTEAAADKATTFVPLEETGAGGEAAGATEASDADAEAADAKKRAEEAAREQALLQAEMKHFQRLVTLGQWSEVKSYLAGLPEEEGGAGYRRMLRSLQRGPKIKARNSQEARYAEKNVFSAADIFGLLAAAPVTIDDEILTSMGAILTQCLNSGNDLQSIIEQIRSRLSAPEASPVFPIGRRQVARWLLHANQPVAAGEFLPGPEKAEADGDREALNLLARHYLGRYAREHDKELLEQAWRVTQAALAAGSIGEGAKREALARAVDLAPKLAEELGQAWLDESFTSRPERGMEILATIGSAVSQGLQKKLQDANERYRGLELQSHAAAALLKAAPERAREWKSTLTLLAENWLREAVTTYQYDQSTRRGPALQRDPYGNYFYVDDGYNRRNSGGGMPRAIPTGQLLEIRPGDDWLSLIDEALEPKFSSIYAQLLLKVGEEADAFPYIEELARRRPEQAEDLVDEFLNVWTRNHNPNSNNSRTNPYMFIYGFDQRASGIPLTRSKQERNLRELAQWTERLRELPLGKIDEDGLTRAFTTAHSTAEVYRLETIEAVFGPLNELQPSTLAGLIERMRGNLVTVWRQPNTQKDKKTNRGPKEIQSEVLRGYAVAESVVDQGLEDHPDEWSLVLAKAALQHDENNYLQEIEKNPEFAARRREALDQFHGAADLYARAVEQIPEDEETAKVYETWFYAALGACDLQAIDEEKQLVSGELGPIRAAIEALGGETAERHMNLFANSLFTRMSSVNPAVKFRYLRAGLEIAGDSERAQEASEIFAYYGDLINEIELHTHVDGNPVIGHTAPFGLFVDIRHTREIERESGGFGKYLVNQNNQGFSYNYGRPTEDYRDKFEEAARKALEEHFEVLSVTFNHPDVHSIAEEEYGWRYTPYAYILLKSRGPEVDTIPSLRLDMDFLDMSGYAIIPIESAPLLVDSQPTDADPRPYQKLHVTQTLDERQADKGKLILEIKASALGLVPDLERIVDLASDGFEITGREDLGVSVAEFDEESEDVAVVAERTWMITFEGRKDLEKLPETFRFAAPRTADAEMEYLRYVDADLESVPATVALNQHYGEKQTDWTWFLVPLGLAVLVLGFFLLRSSRRSHAVAAGRFALPDSLTPFTVIGLLRDIRHNNGLAPSDRSALDAEIERLERHYFLETQADEPDLELVARSWLQKVS